MISRSFLQKSFSASVRFWNPILQSVFMFFVDSHYELVALLGEAFFRFVVIDSYTLAKVI